jgi:hypothetical protein
MFFDHLLFWKKVSWLAITQPPGEVYGGAMLYSLNMPF